MLLCEVVVQFEVLKERNAIFGPVLSFDLRVIAISAEKEGYRGVQAR